MQVVGDNFLKKEGKANSLLPIIPSPTGSGKSMGSEDMWSQYHSGCVPKQMPMQDTKRIVKPKIQRRILNQDEVASYLDSHTEFLERFVLRSVTAEVLERWLLRKMKMNTVAKPGEKQKSELYRFNMCLHSDKRQLFQNVLETIKVHPTQEQVLWELGFCISSAVGVDGFNIFTISKADSQFMNVFIGSPTEKPVRTVRISQNTLPIINDVVQQAKAMRLCKRSPESKIARYTVSSNKDANYAMYLPIHTPIDDTTAVLEMWRMTSKFHDYDEEIASSYLVWGSIALHYVHLYTDMMKQRKLQEYLLHVAESIFEDMGSMEVLIEKIMHYAQELVHADRASLFLVDSKSSELYATVFDVGVDAAADKKTGINRSRTPKEEIRFPIGTGIAGHVAQTGQVLNIKDAYNDDRFNSSVDLKTGYRTKSLLCMPVYIRNTIIGVVQMVNKRGEAFTASDVEAFKMFATYCGLALHHAKLYSKIRRSEQKYKVAIEVLSYHNTCHEDEVNHVLEDLACPNISLDDFYFDPFLTKDAEKVKSAVRMFEDLFGLNRFNKSCLARFILTVRKNYRKVPYHNWTHGFSVSNSMYNILKRHDGVFTRSERLALFIGSLCHDLDHRGKNNKFMLESESPLAAMYSTSTLEHHHFNQTVIILQQNGHNIFSQLSNAEFKHLLSILKHCILATDLAAFFPNRDRLQNLLSEDKFDWDNSDHRSLAIAISMTSADLSAAAKPWHIQSETVKVIFQEFYDQGDAERAAGREPIPMMDRHRPEERATSQVGFLNGICIPCYGLLEQIIPQSKPLHDMCKQNLARWLDIERRVREYMAPGDKCKEDIACFFEGLIEKD